MRPRTIILALAGVLLLNGLIVLGVWLWLNQNSAATDPAVKVATDASSRESSVIDVESDQPLRPAILLAAPSTPSPASGMAWAEFDSPREGEAVSRRFRASGRCDSLPSGSRLMLVVDSGRSVFSPKLPPVTVDGENWSGSANEFGAPTGGSFSLCLFVVSEEAVAQFTEWHAQGRATGKYPPFRGTLPGGTMLTRIKLRVASP
jgi:hypothetical protein